jgi:hypothetical protein
MQQDFYQIPEPRRTHVQSPFWIECKILEEAVRHKRTEKRKLLKEAKEVLKTVIPGIDI